jgi:hypothetical protein
MAKEASLTFVDDPRAFKGADRIARIPAGIADKKDLLEHLAHGLGLPAWFGHNWDALEESLREFSWAKGAKSIAIVHEALPAKLGEDELRTYLDILAGAVAGLRKAKDRVPALQVVFPAAAREQIRKLLA